MPRCTFWNELPLFTLPVQHFLKRYNFFSSSAADWYAEALSKIMVEGNDKSHEFLDYL